MAFGRRENGIWGGANLFCDQKRFQKSPAVSPQRTFLSEVPLYFLSASGFYNFLDFIALSYFIFP